MRPKNEQESAQKEVGDAPPLAKSTGEGCTGREEGESSYDRPYRPHQESGLASEALARLGCQGSTS